MRSLIILEVEHGDTTDPLVGLVKVIGDVVEKNAAYGFRLLDYTVRVDLPGCFVLDSPPGGECTTSPACTAVSHYLDCPR